MNNFRVKIGLATVFCLITGFLSIWLGAAELSAGDVLRGLLSGPEAGVEGAVVWYVRLPRTAGCLLAGAALAVSGCVIQAVLGNRLASPGIIGVNAGAGLAVTVLCALGIFSGWAMAAGSFLGALCAALVVMLGARQTGASRSTVILGGVAVNSILNALSQAVSALVPEAASLSADFRVGGFASVPMTRLAPAAVLIVGSLVILFTLHNEIDVLTLGEETAQALGMDVKKIRVLLLALAALLAGASVSFAGLLGFVGLVVPHGARFLAGSRPRQWLPMSALLGAGLVTVCDLTGRLIFAPQELSAGIVMALIGGPFFLGLLMHRKGGRHAAAV